MELYTFVATLPDFPPADMLHLPWGGPTVLEEESPDLLLSTELTGVPSTLCQRGGARAQQATPLQAGLSGAHPCLYSEGYYRMFAIAGSTPLPAGSRLEGGGFCLFLSICILVTSTFSDPTPVQELHWGGTHQRGGTLEGARNNGQGVYGRALQRKLLQQHFLGTGNCGSCGEGERRGDTIDHLHLCTLQQQGDQ